MSKFIYIILLMLLCGCSCTNHGTSLSLILCDPICGTHVDGRRGCWYACEQDGDSIQLRRRALFVPNEAFQCQPKAK